jgi:hypothetical protein
MGKPFFCLGYDLTQSWLNLHTLSIDRMYQVAAQWRPHSKLLGHARCRANVGRNGK